MGKDKKVTFLANFPEVQQANDYRDDQAASLRGLGLTKRFGVSVKQSAADGWDVMLHEYTEGDE